MWDKKQQKYITQVADENVISFLSEFEQLCKKHNLSIAHEDTHGAFIIEEFNQFNIDWIKEASLNIEI